MARPVTIIQVNNDEEKKIILSYIMTTARYDLTLFEKRIICKIFELASDELIEHLPDGLYRNADRIGAKVARWQYGRVITIPIRAILGGPDYKNYEVAKAAFKSLSLKGIEIKRGKKWSFTNIIAFPDWEEVPGMVTFTVHNRIWDAALDFSKGYRLFELQTTMRFKSTYSMRMYELMSGQKKPLSYDLEEFRKMIGVEGKYSKTNLLEQRTLDVAMKELDASSPISFRYERITTPCRGRNGEKVTGYTFHPIYNAKNEPVAIETEKKRLIAQLGIRYFLPDELLTYLTNKGFLREDIEKHKELWKDFMALNIDHLDKLSDISARSNRASNRMGYLVNAVKGMIEDYNKGRIYANDATDAEVVEENERGKEELNNSRAYHL